VPYHDFNVSGRIERTGGGPLQNYTVALAARGIDGRDGYTVIGDGAQPLALTSESGQFVLSAKIYRFLRDDEADSLAVAVLVPGDDFIMGERFATASVRPTEDRRVYEEESDGCCESPVERESVVGYIYYYRDLVVTIP
jgi:hypothetical protein